MANGAAWSVRTSFIVADTLERRVTGIDTALFVRDSPASAAQSVILATLDLHLRAPASPSVSSSGTPPTPPPAACSAAPSTCPTSPGMP
jgi:hypothetical protein